MSLNKKLSTGFAFTTFIYKLTLKNWSINYYSVFICCGTLSINRLGGEGGGAFDASPLLGFIDLALSFFVHISQTFSRKWMKRKMRKRSDISRKKCSRKCVTMSVEAIVIFDKFSQTSCIFYNFDFFCEISAPLLSRKIRIFFAKQIKAMFREKSGNFAFLRASKMRKF